MIEKVVPAKHQLRGDTLENFEAKNPILANKEPAIVIMPDSSILFKVGDGVTSFADLEFTSALAYDVSDWAKQEEKPTYSLDEIEGLQDVLNTIPKAMTAEQLRDILTGEGNSNE